MALTATRKYSTVPGDAYLSIFEITFDSSYPTGGEALTAAILGVNEIVQVLGFIDLSTDDKHTRFNANGNLIIQVVSTGAEAANASDQSGYVTRVLALVR